MDRVVAHRLRPKILVTGTHSTGKTSLLRASTTVLEGVTVKVVGESARNCPFLLNRDQNSLSTMWLLAAQVKVEIEAQATRVGDIVACDRGVPDILACHQAVTGDDRVMWSQFAAEWMPTYDYVLVAEPDPRVEMAPDPLRVEDSKLRADVQRNIEAWVSGSTVRHLVLPHLLAERIGCVRRCIREVLS